MCVSVCVCVYAYVCLYVCVFNIQGDAEAFAATEISLADLEDGADTRAWHPLFLNPVLSSSSILGTSRK